MRIFLFSSSPLNSATHCRPNVDLSSGHSIVDSIIVTSTLAKLRRSTASKLDLDLGCGTRKFELHHLMRVYLATALFGQSKTSLIWDAHVPSSLLHSFSIVARVERFA